MYPPPLPNAQTGIQLAQQGRTRDALAYLRQSVQTEAATADVWLWLAHVSPDINEYRNCVYQALLLEPHHAIARRMQEALNQLAYPSPAQSYPGSPYPTAYSSATPPAYQPALPAVGQPAYAALPYSPYRPYPADASPRLAADEEIIAAVERNKRRRKRLRRWAALLVILLALVGISAGLRVLLASDEFTDWLNDLPWFDDSQTLSFTLDGAEAAQWRFEVTAPPGWRLADTRIQSWRDARDRLKTEFPPENGELSVWEKVETDLSQITVEPEIGLLQPPITLIETDTAAARRDSQNLIWLQLIRLAALPEGIQGSSCEVMDTLAADELDDLRVTDEQFDNVVDSGVQEQDGGQCIYVVHYRDLSPLTGLYEHIYVLKTLAGDGFYSEWHLTVVDRDHERYQHDIERVIETLSVRKIS
jgi:hypothetical protein